MKYKKRSLTGKLGTKRIEYHKKNVVKRKILWRISFKNKNKKRVK